MPRADGGFIGTNKQGLPEWNPLNFGKPRNRKGGALHNTCKPVVRAKAKHKDRPSKKLDARRRATPAGPGYRMAGSLNPHKQA